MTENKFAQTGYENNFIGADQVVGQALRYIGWVQENEAKENQKVSGLIIAKQRDLKIHYAIKTLNNIRFMTYSVKFELREGS